MEEPACADYVYFSAGCNGIGSVGSAGASANLFFFFETIGANPFQYWLLMNSVGFGNQLYSTLFWVFPVLVTGMVYYSEQKSSMSKFFVIRKSKTAYFISKIGASFVTAFVFFLVLLLINLAVTWCVFPADAPLTEQYKFIVPSAGTFGDKLYQYSPLTMAVGYSVLNALALALLSVFAIALQMIIRFRNQYIAMAVPVILIYTMTFIFDSAECLYSYDIRMVIQPMAACALNELITVTDILVTFCGWILIDIILVIVGIINNRDVL